MSLTNDEKLWLYTNGYYCMQAPPVHHTMWDREAWIKWIDQHGSWGHNALKMRPPQKETNG